MTRTIGSRLSAADTRQRPSIQLHIEELVLHGFAPGEQQAIELGLQLELTRLLTARGLSGALASGSAIDSLDAGSFRLRADGRAEVGNQIACSVYAATAAAMTTATSLAAGPVHRGGAHQ